MSKVRSKGPIQLKREGYDFGGPIGAFIISAGLPPLVYAFHFLCNDVSGCPAPSLLSPSTLTLNKLKQEVGWKGIETIFNIESLLASLGWYGFSLILYALLPAHKVQGTELYSGGRLKYRFNAFLSAVTTLALLTLGTIAQGTEFPVWTFIWANFTPLFTSNLILSFALATYVYIKSFSVKPGNAEKRELAAGGHTGNVLYDWYIGRELNPRVTFPLFGEVDIKLWMEMRPGLLGWIVMNFAFMVKQYKNYGYVTDSIVLITIFQAFYVLDGLYMEPAILTTMDCITDGFGFMLAFGDIAWLPFIYPLQTRYLAIHPVTMGPWAVLTFGVLGVGYYIFRASNNEKNRFRKNPRDPAVAHLKYISTKAGSRLLISGWWGTARHINYLGDWIMSWAYCIPTGFAGYLILRTDTTEVDLRLPAGSKVMLGSDHSRLQTVVYPGDAQGWGMVVTYFFMLYFATLLIHREDRDEEKCRSKYGKDWDEYCKKVPARIVPYVF